MSKWFEEVLCFHCGPALCGIKASNLINLSCKDFPNLEEDLEYLNLRFNPYINFTILKSTKKSKLVLVWNKKVLEKTIFNEKSKIFLLNHNYPDNKKIDTYLITLKYRLNTYDDFPHEIGVFLGYDLEDIIDFELGKKKCIYTGYWKVFSNLEKKLQTFEKFTKCRNLLVNLISNGYRIENILNKKGDL